jgi:hypothetical protein
MPKAKSVTRKLAKIRKDKSSPYAPPQPTPREIRAAKRNTQKKLKQSVSNLQKAQAKNTQVLPPQVGPLPTGTLIRGEETDGTRRHQRLITRNYHKLMAPENFSALYGPLPTNSRTINITNVFNDLRPGEIDMIALLYLEFRTTMFYHGDSMWIFSTNEKNIGSWKQVYLDNANAVLNRNQVIVGDCVGESKSVASIYQRKNNYNGPLLVPAAGALSAKDNISLLGAEGNGKPAKNALYPFENYYDGKKGIVLFANIPARITNADLNALLLDRWANWSQSGRSQLINEASQKYPNILNRFTTPVSFSQANIANVPFLTFVYNNSNINQTEFTTTMSGEEKKMNAAAKKNFLAKKGIQTQMIDHLRLLIMTNKGCSRGAVRHLTNMLASSSAITNINIDEYNEQTKICGNPLAVLRSKTGACSVARLFNAKYELKPELRLSQEEIAASSSGIFNRIFKLFTNFNPSSAQIFSPGVWIIVDLPRMPHSILIILRKGILYTIGAGYNESTITTGLRGTTAPLEIYSPDTSMFSTSTINPMYQFPGVIHGDFMHVQQIRNVGFYNQHVQSRLEQIIATGEGSGKKNVTFKMPSSFGNYHLVSNCTMPGFNCTATTLWITGTGSVSDRLLVARPGEGLAGNVRSNPLGTGAKLMPTQPPLQVLPRSQRPMTGPKPAESKMDVDDDMTGGRRKKRKKRRKRKTKRKRNKRKRKTRKRK